MTTIKIFSFFNEICMPNLIRYVKNQEFSIITSLSKNYYDDGSLSAEISIVQELDEFQKQKIINLFSGTAIVEFS